MSDLMEPIILEPAGLTPEQGWAECQPYADALVASNGDNMWAAFGADPGVTSCPECKQKYWAWGTRLKCVQCGAEFPTRQTR